jgi:hypothetical protein
VRDAQPLPGTRVAGNVVARHPWGLEVLLDDRTTTVADMRFIDDDVIVWGGPRQWPAVGARVCGQIQGTMPNGQVRITLRLSDQV